MVLIFCLFCRNATYRFKYNRTPPLMFEALDHASSQETVAVLKAKNIFHVARSDSYVSFVYQINNSTDEGQL